MAPSCHLSRRYRPRYGCPVRSSRAPRVVHVHRTVRLNITLNVPSAEVAKNELLPSLKEFLGTSNVETDVSVHFNAPVVETDDLATDDISESWETTSGEDVSEDCLEIEDHLTTDGEYDVLTEEFDILRKQVNESNAKFAAQLTQIEGKLKYTDACQSLWQKAMPMLKEVTSALALITQCIGHVNVLNLEKRVLKLEGKSVDPAEADEVVPSLEEQPPISVLPEIPEEVEPEVEEQLAIRTIPQPEPKYEEPRSFQEVFAMDSETLKRLIPADVLKNEEYANTFYVMNPPQTPYFEREAADKKLVEDILSEVSCVVTPRVVEIRRKYVGKAIGIEVTLDTRDGGDICHYFPLLRKWYNTPIPENIQLKAKRTVMLRAAMYRMIPTLRDVRANRLFRNADFDSRDGIFTIGNDSFSPYAFLFPTLRLSSGQVIPVSQALAPGS